MQVYNYSEYTREFTGQNEAVESPLEPGVFLLPGRATFVAPPEAPVGQVAIFVGQDSWALVPDYRGKISYKAATSEMRRVEMPGEPTDGFSMTLTGIFSEDTDRGVGLNRLPRAGEYALPVPEALVEQFILTPHRYHVAAGQVYEHPQWAAEEDARLLKEAKEAKWALIRERLVLEEKTPVTTPYGTFTGGEGSAGAINGAMQLCQALGEPDVLITDANNEEGHYTYEQAAQIIVMIGVAARAAFFHKQERMRAVAAATTVEEVESTDIW